MQALIGALSEQVQRQRVKDLRHHPAESPQGYPALAPGATPRWVRSRTRAKRCTVKRPTGQRSGRPD